MRRSRFKRNNKVSRDKLISFLAFFVFAPLISVLLGIAIVRYVILPQFTQEELNTVSKEEKQAINENNTEENQIPADDENVKEETEESLKLNRDINTIYNVQVGNFKEINNALAMINDMEKNGIMGYVVELDSYKVFAASFYNREEADEYASKVKEKFKDTFISTINIKENIIKYKKEDDEYVSKILEVMDLLNNAYGEEASLWVNAARNNEVSLIKQVMDNNTQIIEEKIKQYKDKVASNDIIELIGKIEKLISQRKDIIIKLGNEDTDLNELYKMFFNNMFEYINEIYRI